MTLRVTNEAIHFLQSNAGSKQPFFLMVSYLTPHVPPMVSKYFLGKSGHGIYYDSVLEMDWSVGKIMAALKQMGVDNDTVVFFSSDNGPTPYHGYTNEMYEEEFHGSVGSLENSVGQKVKLRGWKGTNFEGGIRVPGIIRWLNTISGGLTVDAITSHMDLLPTILDIVGRTDYASSLIFDGKSLYHLLKDPEGHPTHHKLMFHFCDMKTIGAITYHEYKLHFMEGIHNYTCRGIKYNEPHLYNLAQDPGEEHPLDLDEHDEVVLSMDVAKRQLENAVVGGPIVSQLDLPPVPWYFPCDNFPSCTKKLPDNEKYLDNFPGPGIP